MLPRQNETILVMFEEALNQLALSPSTIINYLADVRAFQRWGSNEVDSEFSLLAVNQSHIRRYRHHLGYELKRAIATINRHMMALRKFFTFALEMGLVSSDPLAGVSLVQESEPVGSQPLSEAAVRQLFQAARQGPRPGLARRDVAILALLLHTGLRVSEIVQLQTEDLIFDHPGVRLAVADKRQAKVRYLPLSDQIYRALNDYLTIRPQSATTNQLFLTQRGQPLSERTVQRIISGCAKSAGLAGVSAQAFRRTFACQLYSETGNLALVSERLGHQTPAITAQYLLVPELVDGVN
jgi:integrase/recombinase XerC